MLELSRKDYLNIIDNIITALEKSHSDICFYGYGTLWENKGIRFNSKTSDIDGYCLLKGINI